MHTDMNRFTHIGVLVRHRSLRSCSASAEVHDQTAVVLEVVTSLTDSQTAASGIAAASRGEGEEGP